MFSFYKLKGYSKAYFLSKKETLLVKGGRDLRILKYTYKAQNHGCPPPFDEE